VFEGTEPAQQAELVVAKPVDVDESLGASQKQPADTKEGFHRADSEPCRAGDDLANSENAPEKQHSAPAITRRSSKSPQSESEDLDRFSYSLACHPLLHPIAL
jgi:hypothetical protein